MSWSQHLEGDYAMTKMDVDSVLDVVAPQCPEPWTMHLCGPQGYLKQQWGWSAATDVWLEKDGKVVFSGAGFSRNSELPQRFEAECRKRGLDVRLGEKS